MACCEKCWGEAFVLAYHSGKSQVECYHELLKAHEEMGIICTPKEQAGQFWDEEGQCDSRKREDGGDS